MSSRSSTSERLTRPPHPRGPWPRPHRAGALWPRHRLGLRGVRSTPQRARPRAAVRYQTLEPSRREDPDRCRLERRHGPLIQIAVGSWHRICPAPRASNPAADRGQREAATSGPSARSSWLKGNERRASRRSLAEAVASIVTCIRMGDRPSKVRWANRRAVAARDNRTERVPSWPISWRYAMRALLVGYARSSTDPQHLTAQRDALLGLGVEGRTDLCRPRRGRH